MVMKKLILGLTATVIIVAAIFAFASLRKNR